MPDVHTQRRPKFVTHYVDGIAVDTGHRRGTQVDVILVPCPGADPVNTWVDEGRKLWATSGIRARNLLARVLTYDHGEVQKDWTLKSLAEALLRVLYEERSLIRGDAGDPDQGLTRNRRPVFFICHSIGGLVAKLALAEACRHPMYRRIVDYCYGITFFATPHQGSSYMFMDDYAASIKELLGLQVPLPVKLVRQLNVDDPTLQRIDEIFKQLVGEFQVWTFYETVDSLLRSSMNTATAAGPQYRAPITPMRSAILGVRQEKIYALRSTHADCASFEDVDLPVLTPYLQDLCDRISKAAEIHRNFDGAHRPLDSSAEVLVEVHGFYETRLPPKMNPVVRLRSVDKQSLQRFLSWGPDALLKQRLVDTQPVEKDYGPMIGRGLRIGRTFVWKGPQPESDDDTLPSPSEPRPVKGQFLDHKGRASSLAPDETETRPSLRTQYLQPVDAVDPDQEEKKFEWIHIPFNNPSWVAKVFETLPVNDKRDYSDLFTASHWVSRHTRARHAQHHACFLKSSCASVPLPAGGFTMEECRYLYLPYLHFDTYKSVVQRRNLIRKRQEHGRAKPVPGWVSREESLELRTIWEFLGHDPPINCRRTLDQYRYPSIHDTRARDDDQVLYKLTKERVSTGAGVIIGEAQAGDDQSFISQSDEEDVLDGKLLMVDQLWMWVMKTPDHNSRLVTFYTKREGSPLEGSLLGQADLRDITYNDLNAGVAQRCETASDLAALTILHAVTVLLDRSSHPDLDIFRIFEEAVSVLTETMTSSLKRYGMSAFSTKYASFQSFEGTELMSIHDRHRLEDERAKEESRNSTSTLLALRDVEDELLSLMNLFSEQQEYVTTMLEISEAKEGVHQHLSGVPLTANGRGFLTEALEKLKAYKGQVQDMVERVQKAVRDFDRLLEIVQKQTQFEDGYLSRHQADLSRVQNRSVVIFTIFSVVFLPLSFFTSVFGMNTREWGGGDNLPLSTIWSIAVPVSVALISGTVIAAWVIAEGSGYAYARRQVERCKRHLLSKVMPTTLLQTREQRKKKIRRRKEQRKSEEIINPDFWDRHRLERDRKYEIPAGNRKRATLERARRMAAASKGDLEKKAVLE